MNTLTKCMVVAVFGAMLSHCAMDNSDVGTLTGGVVGGILGNQIGHGSGRVVATGIGALAGAFIGERIGRHLDEHDQRRVNEALEYNQLGESSQWTNPDNGNRYVVEPTQTYNRRHDGHTQPCREFTTIAYIGGKQSEIYGKACRMDDGSWEMVK